jgi:hypothetical protein
LINQVTMSIAAFVSDKSFSDVRSACIERDVQVRTKNPESEFSNLYLMYASGDDEYNEFNGVILEKESNKVVCACQRRVRDVDFAEFLALARADGVSPKYLEYCEDGPVVRLYFYNNKWNTATTKCIDGRDSYWASEKTFDDMFFEIFDGQSMFQSLDTSYTYIFVLLHVENRIVVRHAANHLVFVGRINNDTLQQDSHFDYTNTTLITPPTRLDLGYLDELTSTDALFNVYKRGLLLHLSDGETTHFQTYKCDFPQYRLVKQLRGNIPDIEQRYLELLKEPQGLIMLEYYYFEHRVLFDGLKQRLADMIKAIYSLYVESHIRHNVRVTEEHIFHRTLKQLHAQHKKTRIPVTIDIVRDKVLRMDTSLIRKLLRSH